MAVEAGSTAPASPPRLSASSPPTVGTLLTRASAACASRGCSSPRSLLSRILHRGRRGGGFGCRLRLPRYCSSGAAAKEDDVVVVASAAAAATAKEEETEPTEAAAAPHVPVGVGGQPALCESHRSSLEKKAIATPAEDALPATLGLGASLVLLLSKSAAELSRMAELRAQMERLLADARADVRSCDGRPSAASGDPAADSASVVKGPVACAADEEGALCPRSDGSPTAHRGGTTENAAARRDMDRMEAELEAELSRLQRASDDEERSSPRRDNQLELLAEPMSSASSRSHSEICSDSDNDDGETDNGGDESQDRDDDGDGEEEEDDDESDTESNVKSPPHGGVSARELERRLHELLQSRSEARIAELESALERARRKLRETEREACRWRDTAKLATRFTDESRLR
ncbi:hypothetical protein U9M48_021629 [Paspalum notatum var. saurae]|uniref:Uncharacterized protein n=1 Tax=Paspalum notatum var. saurae TaxID=547442 RepID=A0AAQ3TG11_PASNO